VGRDRANEPETWEELYTQVNGEESRRSARVRQLLQEQQALEQFEAWRSRAIDQLMNDLREGAESRAEDFLEHTGLELRVATPHTARVTVPNGPEVRFLRLELGNALVHVYTSHVPGSLTHVHLLPSRGTSIRNNERLVSEPGAFIVRTQGEGYELRYQRGDPEGRAAEVMTLDTLLFRGFRLLVQWSGDP
jgi:hypothetical protein